MNNLVNNKANLWDIIYNIDKAWFHLIRKTFGSGRLIEQALKTYLCPIKIRVGTYGN